MLPNILIFRENMTIEFGAMGRTTLFVMFFKLDQHEPPGFFSNPYAADNTLSVRNSNEWFLILRAPSVFLYIILDICPLPMMTGTYGLALLNALCSLTGRHIDFRLKSPDPRSMSRSSWQHGIPVTS